MINFVRQLLRNRRNARRIARDEASDARLNSETGRSDFLALLDEECAQSSLIALLEDALKQPGDIIECGVFRGDSLRRILKTVKDRAPDRTVFGLDSFEGFPPGGITGMDITRFRSKDRLEGKFTNADDVPARLNRFADAFEMKLDLHKGYFEHTLGGVSDRTFAFLHIDCDTYAGHIEVLDALYDRVVPGGIIVFDDYNTEEWPGATQAVDEFLADRPESVQVSHARAKPAYYMIKAA
ncbi:MAG: hypothetical protein HKN18_13735 [Silicimonas sp.]|nr:hypothetical protein [Silicimonas sp.]